MKKVTLTGRNAPCKDCKNRNIHCHADCEKYKDFLIYNDELRKKKNEETLKNKFQSKEV